MNQAILCLSLNLSLHLFGRIKGEFPQCTVWEQTIPPSSVDRVVFNRIIVSGVVFSPAVLQVFAWTRSLLLPPLLSPTSLRLLGTGLCAHNAVRSLETSCLEWEEERGPKFRHYCPHLPASNYSSMVISFKSLWTPEERLSVSPGPTPEVVQGVLSDFS